MFPIHCKKYILLVLAFILFTVIGTLSHECGHMAVAKYLGYETTLHYGSMQYNSSLFIEFQDLLKENRKEISENLYFKDKDRFEFISYKIRKNSFLICLGGPMQTMLTGTLGLFILAYRRKIRKEKGMQFMDWIAVFLSLFWLREVHNVVMSIGSEIVNPNGSYFGGDEKNLSQMLHLPLGTFPILLGLIGMGVSLLVIFKIIPFRLRFTFILSGFIGGISGYILWFYIFGPIVIP